MSTNGFPADSALPQLPLALNPALMCGVLEEHLRPLSGALRIEQCRLVRIRYRPGIRCFLQYGLSLIDTGAGRRSTHWVTGALFAAAGRAERIWRRAAADTSRCAATCAPFEPACFIPDLDMVVQVFPHDRRLPSLPAMMHRPARLEGSLLEHFGPGEWRVEDGLVEAIRYREHLGAVLRYTVRARDALSGRLDSRRFYIKVYADDRGARTMHALLELHARGSSRGGSLAVVRPLAYVDDMRALVLEEAPGLSLEAILTTSVDGRGVLRDVARALAAFHQEDLPVATRSWSIADQCTALEKWRVLLGWACPRLQSDADAVARRVVAGLEEVEPRPSHRDAKIDHFFVDGDRITAVDLDSFGGADPVVDPASLLAHLTTMRGWLPAVRERGRETAAVFGEEYLSRVPAAWRRRLPIHYASALLRMAADAFHLQRPQWRDETAALIDEARTAVSGKIFT